MPIANGNQFPIIFPHQLGTILQDSAGSDAENAWYLPARAEAPAMRCDANHDLHVLHLPQESESAAASVSPRIDQ